jgi:alkanesulfonate monooxygenase SsuD/methylene tetrahydromethanopterin reductase-like flavin-dependent oxidoreductase (luciferase family)
MFLRSLYIYYVPVGHRLGMTARFVGLDQWDPIAPRLGDSIWIKLLRKRPFGTIKSERIKMLSNGLFYTPLTGATRAEIEAGMAGKDETHYQRLLAELGEQAQAADELGYDKLAISEHHFQVEGFEVPNNPILLNVHLAGLTKRIKLGQLGILAAARHPLLIAEDIVMLDHITKGRCFVGLARGAHTRAVDVLGQKYGAHAPHPAFADADARQVNLEQFEESFEIMKSAWTKDTFSHQGKYWTLPPEDIYFKHPGTDRYGAGQNADGKIEQIGIVPRPYTKPYPQVYVPFTSSPATVQWCARNGIRLVVFTSIDEQIDTILNNYHHAARDAGRDLAYGEGIAHFKSIIVADTEAEARKSAEAVAWAWGEWLGGYGFNEAFRLPGESGAVPNDFDVTQRGQGFIVYGTPDQVVRRLQPFIERYNVDEMFNWVFNGVVSNAEILKSFRLYATEVAPQLAALRSPAASSSQS